MKYLIVDVEGTNGATNDIIEIIEFGYAIVEEDKMVECGGVYIKPEHSKLDRFIVELTGITQDKLENAVTFKQFAEEFFSIHKPEDYVFVAWGDYDSRMMDQCCELAGMEPLNFAKRLNLKRRHKVFYDFKRERGLQRALNHALLGFEGQHHCGAHDALNTARLFLHMRNKGWCHE